MSAVHDEAENGHARSSNNGENETERQNRDDESGLPDGPTIPALKESVKGESRRDSFEDRSSRSYLENGLENKSVSGSGSTPVLGRPSSADGSLSIPDDTPSIQVESLSGFYMWLLTLDRTSSFHLQAEMHVCHLMVKVQHHHFAHSIDDSTLVPLLLHWIHLELYPLDS